MRHFIFPSDPSVVLHLAQLPSGDLLQLQLLHAEDEHYLDPQPIPLGTVPHGHAHDVYHVCLYTEGESRFVLNERLHENRAGTLVVTAPGEFHDLRAHGSGWTSSLECTFTVVADQTATIRPLPFHALLSCCVGVPLSPAEWPVYLSVQQTRQAESLMDALLTRLAFRDALLRLDTERMILDIFRFLAHEVYGVGDARSDPGDPLVRAKAEIESRFNEPLRLPELAHAAGMSSGHFSRAFKALHGVAPMAYQLEVRIRSAKTLLCFGVMPIGEIAQRVGFPDIYTFSRMFQRREGLSPRSFRAGRTRKSDATSS